MTEDEGGVEKLRFGEKLGYGLGDAASNFFFQVFNIFLLYYYTDIYGLAPAAVGTMFLATKAVDAVSDPLMGMVADRTHSRWGKFRPYLLFAAIPYGLLGYAMFAGPQLSDGGRLVYAYVTYTAMMLAYTAINIPYSALMGVISPSSRERTKVSSFRFICAFAAAWLIGTFVTPLKNILGAGDEATGFRRTMLIFAVASVLLFWLTFATTKERVVPKTQPADAKADLKALWRNGPWIALFFAGVFALMNVAIRSGGTLYYFKYWAGDDGTAIFLIFDKTAVFMSTGLFAMVLGITLTEPLSRRFGKRPLMITLTVLNALTLGVFYLIPAGAFAAMVVVNCVGSFIVGPTPALVWAMYADCADYGEWKTGRRTTALIFSAVQFAQKMGLAVGAGLSGFILSSFGFAANQVQTPTALSGIRLMFSVFPAICAILSAVSVAFYRLDEEEVKQIEAELRGRREGMPEAP